MLDAGFDPDITPRALQQSTGFARALAACDIPHVRLPQGSLVLQRSVGPLGLRMLTRPNVPSVEEMRALIAAQPARGPLILAPDTPLALHDLGAVALLSPATIAVLDLTPPLDRLLDGLHPKWRNRLRHAQKQTLRVTRQNMPDDPTHWLLDADEVQQRQRGYRAWPRALTLAFARENPGDAKLFTALWGREPLAAMLVLRHGQTATYHVGHTRASGRLASAHTLLMWRAIVWAKSRGVQRFELGLLDTEDAPGLARFKLGTGAQTHRLGGTWLYWSPLRPLARPLARLDRSLMRLNP